MVKRGDDDLHSSRMDSDDARAAARRSRRRRKKRREQLIRRIILCIIIAALGLGIFAGIHFIIQFRAAKEAEREAKAEAIAKEEEAIAAKRAVIEKAELLAEGYDYDAAIELLTSQENYDTDIELVESIARITASKSTLETKDLSKVPHITVRSLIADPALAFSSAKASILSANYLTTDEFEALLQQLYDNGWVLISMRDLVVETVDEYGQSHFTRNTSLKLPADKKPYILSVDDWNYYHEYEGYGFANKAVLNENGDVKVEFTDSSGQTRTGDYDAVPIIESFCTKHPDAAYHGARATIAVTGYQGVFGLRTAPTYDQDVEHRSEEQQMWLNLHPDFDYSTAVYEATAIAAKLKEDGFDFAYHTYGNINVSGRNAQELAADFSQWMNHVKPILGDTDIYIFAGGTDIGDWHDYDLSTNGLFAYFWSNGFNYYCNIDMSTQSWQQIRDTYVRTGRIEVNGRQLLHAIEGTAVSAVYDGLFDPAKVYDTSVRTRE